MKQHLPRTEERSQLLARALLFAGSAHACVGFDARRSGASPEQSTKGISMALDKKALLGAVAALAATLGVAHDSSAQDAKLLSGVACSFRLNDTFLAHQKADGFQNRSGASRTVVCPIVKDNIGGDLSDVSVLTTTSVSPSSCFVTLRPFGGGALDFEPAEGSVEEGDGYRSIVWSDLSAPSEAADVYCMVPHLASIFSVQHSE